MKNIRRKMLSTILAVSLSLGSTILNMPVSASAGNEMTVTVSMEGLTLGQGMYFEPETYTLSEINNLVNKEGYGPFDESNLNAGIATLAFFIDNNIEYINTGSWGEGSLAENGSTYISQIKGIDRGNLNIPQIILDNGFKYEEKYAQKDEYLGEKDYGDMSGWMVTVNNLVTPVGVSGWNLNQNYDGYEDYNNNYVIRWQFTLNGYGADLGFQGWGAPPYYERANKDLLYMKYAELSENGTFNSNPELKTQALSIMEKLDATQEEVDNALAVLESAGKLNVDEVLDDTLSKMAQAVPEPSFNSEWTALSLARSGYFDKDSDYFKGYYDRIVDTVNEKASSVNKNGALSKTNYTDNSRLIIALSAIGKDAHSVGNWDIIAPLVEDYDTAMKQGVNGAVYALIALDTHNYQTSNTEVRQKYIDFILSKEIDGGGWAFFGKNPDVDMTAMTLQALSRYTDNADVASAVERGINVLSSLQKEDGGYVSWGNANAESIAQVITACTALGIDPNKDERFVKNGNSVVDALFKFYDKDSVDYTFCHTMNGKGNAMATNQASYALVAYKRFIEGRNSLYDMTDVKFESIPVKFGGATVSLGGNIGVNLYMELDDSIKDNNNAYMQIELPNGETVSEAVKDAKVSVVDGKNYYVFSCEVSAKEMSDKIKVQMIVDNNPIGAEYTYSVKEYADKLLDGNNNETEKNLVKAMLNYGDYANAYFNGESLDTPVELSNVTAETLADFSMNSNGSLPNGIEYYGSSLLLESDTTLRHYFKVDDGTNVSKYGFTGNKGNYYYIDRSGISADNLDSVCRSTVGDYVISYSPMSYAYAVLSNKNSSESLKNVVRALYLYNQTADAYKK